MEVPFSVQYRFLEDAVAADFQGDLTRLAEEQLIEGKSWESGLEGGRRFLILNFNGTTYINSAGIAILIRIVRAGRKAGYQTFAYGITPHYQKLFRMVGLTEYLMIYPEEYSVLRRIDEDQGRE